VSIHICSFPIFLSNIFVSLSYIFYYSTCSN
jgi:hypothetical protein